MRKITNYNPNDSKYKNLDKENSYMEARYNDIMEVMYINYTLIIIHIGGNVRHKISKIRRPSRTQVHINGRIKAT